MITVNDGYTDRKDTWKEKNSGQKKKQGKKASEHVQIPTFQSRARNA